MSNLFCRKVKWIIFTAIWFLVTLPVTYAGESRARKIKLGVIGPMAFLAGKSTDYGATMAVEEINSSGGVHVGKARYNIDIFKADDNCLRNVSDAVSAMERLITVDQVDFVIGGYHSESVFAQQDIMADHKKIFIDSGSASLRQPARLAKDYERYKYYFRIMTTSIHTGESILGSADMVADKFRKELGIKTPRVALLMEKLVWVDPIVPFCQKHLSGMGMEVVGVWRPSSMASDLTAEWTAIKASDAHMVLEISSGPTGTISPRQWAGLQIPVALLGNSLQAMVGSHWEDTNKNCNYQLTTSTIGPAEVTPKTMPFYHKFEKKYGGYAHCMALQAYDAVYVLKKAIERAGSLDTEKVVKSLEKTDFIGVLGRIIFEPRDHKYPHMNRVGPGYYTMVAFQWIDGKQVVVWPDGRALLGDKTYVGYKYGGTKDYVLPPWVIKYWKEKKH
ncbi:MAG: ABC transporter substrate-binding protein [Thermodesulfobacteriota bacterium]|nr:ABC transporter substrate-binding protein [Thermodesulfobacteriota bacterium]